MSGRKKRGQIRLELTVRSSPKFWGWRNHRVSRFFPPRADVSFLLRQTIARGVGFCFEELTTMFHHVRARQLSELAAAGWQLDDLPRHQRVRVPEINKLRTEKGCLFDMIIRSRSANCAH